MSDNERVDWDMHQTPLTNIVIIHKMQLDQPLHVEEVTLMALFSHCVFLNDNSCCHCCHT